MSQLLGLSSESKMLAGVEETISNARALCEKIFETEDVLLSEAVGRVSAEDIVSLFALPLRDHSAVDGFALGASGSGEFRIVGRRIAGDSSELEIGASEAVRIMTGAPVPKGAYGVVMQERASVSGDSVTPDFEASEGDNIRRAGEDVQALDMLVKAGTRLDARHVALLTAGGYQHIKVARKVKIALLSTGNELRDSGVGIGPGQIFDTNRPMLKALLSSRSVEVADLGIVRDSQEQIVSVLAEAAENHDLIVTSGGVSVGEEDHLKAAVVSAGGEITSWRMAIKPGKPIALGKIGNAVYLGLPGSPLACFVDYLLVGRPILDALTGAAHRAPLVQQARASFSWNRRAGRTEFFPCNIVGQTDEGLPLLEKTGRAGSARLTPLIEADGLGVVAADCNEVKPGEILQFYPFRADMGL